MMCKLVMYLTYMRTQVLSLFMCKLVMYLIFLQDGFFSEPTDLKGVQHIVLLSQVCNALVIPCYAAGSSISHLPQ